MASRNLPQYNHFGKFMGSLKINIHLPHQPGSLLPDITSGDMKKKIYIYIHTKTWKLIFMEASFINGSELETTQVSVD